MEDKRLDFDAPLLSVRRFSAPPPSSSTTSSSNGDKINQAIRNPQSRRSSLPFYKSDLTSGPIRNPGVVPFVWEQTPGLPKGGPRPPRRPPTIPKLPPSRIEKEPEMSQPITSARIPAVVVASLESSEKKVRDELPQPQSQAIKADDEEEDDVFSDAVDRLSRTESFFMNCSISGLSGVPDAPEPKSGSFATDSNVRDFMMGRFLPAAQAVAASSPQCAPRKQRELARPVESYEGGDHRRTPTTPYSYGHNSVHQHDQRGEHDEGFDDEDDEDYDDSGHLPSKACGLLPRFCLKSSFFLMHPVPGMKVRNRLPAPPGRRISSPHTRTSPVSLGQAEDENSWDEVYKHKLGHDGQQQGEEGSRLTSDSNHLTYYSESQTADGSSNRHSAGGISPYRNEAPRSPFLEGKSFLGLPMRERKINGSNGSGSCEKDSESNSEGPQLDGSHPGSGAMSPAIDRSLYVDSVHLPEVLHSKSSSAASNAEMKAMLKPTNEDSSIEDSLVLESSDRDALQPKVSKLVEFMDGEDGLKHNDSHVGPQALEVEDQVNVDSGFLPPLLPPPLPKSPTESWLCRTLPSVSSKNHPQKSFLGIPFQPRKQASQAASTGQKQETNEKPVKVHRQIRFADMLTKPLSPESEI